MKNLVGFALLLCLGQLPARDLKVALSLAESRAVEGARWEELFKGRPVEVTAVGESLEGVDSLSFDVVLQVGGRSTGFLVDKIPLVTIDGFSGTEETKERRRDLVGAVAAAGGSQGWEGMTPLFFTPEGNGHPVSRGISNFDVKAGFVWNLEFSPDARVLATTWTPHQKASKNGEPQPYVYGVTPVIWSLENDGRRRVGINLSGTGVLENPATRAMLMRSLSWAAGSENTDVLCSEDELASLIYPPDGPLAPGAFVNSLEVDPDFEVSLVAAEPLISKPINLDWDSEGRLWVAESLEYPEGRKGGGPESMYAAWQRDSDLPKPPVTNRPGRDRISRLSDEDGDGKMESKVVFADGLDMVTSFCFYRDGIIVAQPPEILFLRDRDGDGKAETREVLYQGLGTFDTHAVLNNLRWGLDGWIYATHGYSGSPKVTSGDGTRDFGPIGSGVIRFRPDGSAIEVYSSKSGNCWGVEFTSEGELFFTQPTSGDLLMHVPLSDRLMAEGGMGHEPSWNVMIRMRPVKPLMTWDEIVENQPNDVIGSFTAACGCAIYEGGSWPEEWARSYFTCEPTVHIVHHEAVTVDGVSFDAHKTREETEFSATRDFWHRPIDTRVGPDGDLYVTDFYNQAILHNDPRGPIHLWNNQAARPDRDHFFGRILRFHHRESVALPSVDLTTGEGRIAALNHPNREVRFRAQRLLEDDPHELMSLAEELADAQGVARIHALWLRAAAGVLSEEEIVSALGHEEVALRLTAARVVREHAGLATESLVANMAERLANEADERVRLAVLSSVPLKRSLPPELLVELASRAKEPWTRAMVFRNARQQPVAVWQAALSPDADSVARQFLGLALIDDNRMEPANLDVMLEALSQAGDPGLSLAILRELSRDDFARGEGTAAALDHLFETGGTPVRAAVLPLVSSLWTAEKLADSIGRISSSVESEALDETEKTAIYRSMGQLPVIPETVQQGLRARLGAEGVLDALIANPSSDAAELLVSAIAGLSPQDKARVIEGLVSREASAKVLVDALENESIPLSVVGASVLSRLSEYPSEPVSTLARNVSRKLRGDLEARDVIVKRLLPEVNQPGDAAAGETYFQACAVCHQYQGTGTNLGPVLDGIGVHSAEVLLTHIVDPNREVEPTFHAWTITKTNGEVLVGMIARETAGSVFLRNAGGEIEVKKDEIGSRVNSGRSLMPEGFEGLGGDVLRDIVAYLRGDSRSFHVLPIDSAATVNGKRGVYASQETETDRISLKGYGLTEVMGVPFFFADPDTTAGGKNVIVLRGGGEGSYSDTLPESTEVAVHQPAGRLHLVGAVAGWGWPVDGEKVALLEIVVHYEDGGTETLAFINGVDFVDHFQQVDVPGSVKVDLVERSQIRYLWRDLGRPGVPVEKLVLRSFNRKAAPLVAALTMESPDGEGTMSAPPSAGGPAQPDEAEKGTPND